jgi:hypothetical protein
MKQGWAFAWRSLMAAEIYVTILTGFGALEVGLFLGDFTGGCVGPPVKMARARRILRGG